MKINKNPFIERGADACRDTDGRTWRV